MLRAPIKQAFRSIASCDLAGSPLELADSLAREVERLRERLALSERENTRLAEQLVEERTRRIAAEKLAAGKAVRRG